MKIETKLIHGGRRHTFNDLGTIVEPIFTSAVYAYHEEINREKPHLIPYKYSREDNPTITHLEEKVKELDEGKYCLAFSSGLSAIKCVIETLISKLRKPTIITPLDLYGSTLVLLKKFRDLGLINLVITNPGTENIVNKLHEFRNSKNIIIYFETISNPILRVYDIEEILKTAKDLNIDCTIIVDNTIPTQVSIRPIEYGAKVVIYSASKYLSGHNDAIGGLVVLNDEDLHIDLWHCRRLSGCIMSPFTAYLVDRGLKTLHLRMRRHEENARIVAEYLQDHPKVNDVIYPGLSTHPDYKISVRILRCTSGIVSFRVKNIKKPSEAYKKLKIIIPGVSFGGPESIITHPLTTTHRYLSEDEKKIVGIDDRLFRLSVGLEDVEDIINDLDNMLTLL